MSKAPQFTLSFNLNLTNDERLAMFELYQKAFNARKTYEGTPPNSDDIHIMMDICGVEILVGPGGATGKGFDNPIGCEVRFTDKIEFDKAYSALILEAKSHSLEGPYPWATLLGLVEDKFGVGWALYYNE
jgi:uncharacterized glyoxalase superfamily protein PhnB